jgi:hypothetical protein
LPLCLLAALALFGTGAFERAAALPIVGNAQTVVRDVKGKLEAELRTLVIDSDVFLDEEISTGANSGTRIVFKDGTNLELGENSRLKLTKLVFDPDPNKSEIAVKALVGVFRWTSGNLPASNYHIGTPVATIGIRGTSLEWTVANSGLTTVALARGSVTVTDSRGNSVTLKPNEATTISAPDPDGSQLAPSTPGPIPTSILQTVFKMTATINLSDAPSVSEPHSGGTGFIERSGGADQVLNPVYFRPPTSTVPTSSTPGGTDPSNSTPGGNAPVSNAPGTGPTGPDPGSTNPPPPLPPSNQSPPPQPLPPAPVIPPPVVTPPVVTLPVITPPVVTPPVITPPPPPSRYQEGTIGLSAQVGQTAQTTIYLHLASGQSITIASGQLFGNTNNAFSAQYAQGQTFTGDISALIASINFVPPPGFPDQVFTATFELTDALGNTYDWQLTGTEIIASISEPSTLALFMLGLGGLALAHRRRRLLRALAGRQCFG